MSTDADFLPVPLPEPGSDLAVLTSLFERAEQNQYAANRQEARRAEDLADALAFARSHPWVYVDDVLLRTSGDHEAAELAERCAAVEAGSRLCLSESAVRSLAGTADVARRRFPHLWHRIREGFASVRYADAVLGHLPAFAAQHDPHALETFDRALAEIALHATVGAFRKKADALVRRLAPLPEEQNHKLAMEGRRVVVDDAPASMAWLSVYGPRHDVRAAFRMLTSAAKHAVKAQRDGRTRDQLRSDLFFRTLLGTGRGARVTTRVFVTVPLDRLTPEAQATVRSHTPGREGLDLNREPMIPGEGPIDTATATQLLLDQGSFTRVVTDPITGVVLDMDRRARTATPAQRAWLVLMHGVCSRDGCTRLAVDADIDHMCMYHSRERGPTNIGNLHPYCDPDHALKDTTRIGHRRRDDRSTQLQFPTGHRTNQATRQRLRDILPGDDPPPF